MLTIGELYEKCKQLVEDGYSKNGVVADIFETTQDFKADEEIMTVNIQKVDFADNVLVLEEEGI